MDHPRPGLRYVDAGELDDTTPQFDGLAVQSRGGEELGTVDGFIIDLASARPVYTVVDAGGWFTSKFFLLPVGHVSLDSAGQRLIADVTRERVSRFPGFDRDEFAKLDDAELARMDERLLSACCPDTTFDRATVAQRYEVWSHYRRPTWWDASYYRPDRADTAARSIGSTAMPSRDEVRAERDRSQQREAVVASAGDESPHFAGRAQPGDVLGIETAGEQTHVGDTTDDENKRREDAVKAARKK